MNRVITVDLCDCDGRQDLNALSEDLAIRAYVEEYNSGKRYFSIHLKGRHVIGVEVSIHDGRTLRLPSGRFV